MPASSLALAAPPRCKPVVDVGISSWIGRTTSCVARWICLVRRSSVLLSSIAWTRCSPAIAIPSREATSCVAVPVWMTLEGGCRVYTLLGAEKDSDTSSGVVGLGMIAGAANRLK